MSDPTQQNQPIPTKLKKTKPRCNLCSRDLNYVRVLGAMVTNDLNLAKYEFDVTIEKGQATAQVGVLQRDEFNATPNPRKFLAEIEMWVEDTAEEVRCPFCTRAIKLTRIPIPQALAGVPTGNPGINPLAQVLQQIQQQNQPSGPFQMGSMSPTFGQNRTAIQGIFDSKLTDQEITDMLADVDIQIPAGTSRSDLLQALMDWFYDN
jgi:hypothetical protein